MPTYQYACTDPECDNRFELVQSFTDPAASECPVCGHSERKVYGAGLAGLGRSGVCVCRVIGCIRGGFGALACWLRLLRFLLLVVGCAVHALENLGPGVRIQRIEYGLYFFFVYLLPEPLDVLEALADLAKHLAFPSRLDHFLAHERLGVGRKEGICR